jgi:hypothetical protein
MTTFGTFSVGIIFSSFFWVKVLTSVANKQRRTQPLNARREPYVENVSFIQTGPPAAVIRVLQTYYLYLRFTRTSALVRYLNEMQQMNA